MKRQRGEPAELTRHHLYVEDAELELRARLRRHEETPGGVKLVMKMLRKELGRLRFKNPKKGKQ